MYKNSVLDVIGNTPLIKLDKIKSKYNLSFNLFGKLERSNPSGSVKDRAALMIILDALKNNKINKTTEIIEATSGNTGISLAMICAYLSLKCTIVMPSSASIERRKMMVAYGANLVLTSPSDGMKGSVELANKLHLENKNSFMASQFDNPSNIKAHYLYTAKEILIDLDNELDVFIAGFGTGGTLSGCGKYFKEFDKNIEVIGIEPASSSLINNHVAGPHKIQGIGANFIPTNFKKEYVDRVIDITNEESFKMCNELAREEGLLVGISSGAALAGSLKINDEKYKDKNVVIILPDNGERYLSVEGLYEKTSL